MEKRLEESISLKGVRITLIHSVLGSLLTYNLSIFKIPAQVAS